MVRPRWSPSSTAPSISQAWPSSSAASRAQPCAQGLADAGRGVDLALVHHGIEHGDAEASGPGPLAQHLDIAAAARAEGEVVAAHDVARAKSLQQDVVDEGIGRQRGERLVEALRQHGLHAVLAQQPDLCRRQGEAEGAGVGHEEAARMRLEGERDQRRAQRARPFAGMRQQRLVAAMHAVEIAERHGAAPPGGGRRPPVVEGRDHAAITPRRVAAPARPPRRRSRPCRRSGTAS